MWKIHYKQIGMILKKDWLTPLTIQAIQRDKRHRYICNMVRMPTQHEGNDRFITTRQAKEQ